MRLSSWSVLACFVLPLTFSCVGDPPIPSTGPVKTDAGPSPIVDGAVTTDSALPPDGAPVDAGTCYALPSNALAWWKGEGNVENALSFSTPRVNDLVWKGTGASKYEKAIVGQGFSLDGASESYLEVGASSGVNTSTSFSIEAWVQFDTVSPARNMVVLSRRPSTAVTIGWSLRRDFNRKLYFDIGALSAEGRQILNDAIPTHIAMTFGSSTVALYVNGVLDVTQPGVTAVPNSTDLIRVGAKADDPAGTKLNGIIDELTLYSRVLTKTEIAAIREAGPAGKCLPQR
jgi:Concanavalin A-like lectin/glucanases superfamily